MADYSPNYVERKQVRHLALYPTNQTWYGPSSGPPDYSHRQVTGLFGVNRAVCNQAAKGRGGQMAFVNDPEVVNCDKCLRWLKAVPA